MCPQAADRLSRRFMPVAWLLAGILACVSTTAQEAAAGPDDPAAADLARIRRLRREAVQRRRRVWFNHDGCDASSFPAALLQGRRATPQDLLDLRTTALADTQVDTLSYCTISSGFSKFTHRTRIGELLTVAPAQEDRVNITQDLVDQGTDPLQVMVEFCHANGMECFWSMRMNDTHDAAWRPDTGHRLFPRLKEEHPEFLVGSYEKRPPYGTWSSVDYSREEIRDLCYRFFEEVCRTYDVDGVEMDFFRHLCFFRRVAEGQTAGPEELNMMTDMLRRIRRMTEREGIRRGRPILVAVRVPDSPGYARAVGLDVETWLAEGLVDCLIGSGYFRLNPWADLARLGQEHGVKVYAGLSESRIRRDPAAHRARASDEAYRGRAMSAWQAGVDGIYIFNVYNAQRAFLHDIGSPATMQGKDTLYFATVRNGSPGRYLADGARFLTRTLLSPENTMILTPGIPARATIELGDDVLPPTAHGIPAEITCRLTVERLKANEPLQVAINGTVLDTHPNQADGRTLDLPPGILKPGLNHLALTLQAEAAPQDRGEPADNETWDVVYKGDRLLKMPSQLPWRRLFRNPHAREVIRDNALYVADLGTGPDEWANLVYPWAAMPSDTAVAEAEVKLIASSAPLGVCLRVANDNSVEYLTLEADRVSLHFAGLSLPMDTTDAFHTYRLVLRDKDIRLYVDGVPALDGSGRFTTSAQDTAHWLNFAYGHADWNARSVAFGSAAGPGTGEALWRAVRLRDNARTWSDLSVRVSCPRPAPDVPRWDIEYTARELPHPPWGIQFQRPNTLAEIRDNALLLADRGTERGDYLYVHHPWDVTPESGGTLEARVRLVSGWASMRCDDGVHSERLEIHPNHIQLAGGRKRYALNTTGDFHLYRLVVHGADVSVYVDGKLRIDGTGLYTRTAANGRRDFGFGASNSPSVGEALWQTVRAVNQAF